MGGPILEQKKEKTQESFQPIEREEELREQHGAGPAELLPGEEWAQHDRAHTLEVMRNQQMAVELRQKSSGVIVDQAASIQQPPFQQRPAQKSGKADKEAKRKRRLAKKLNPKADERTYEMAEGLFAYELDHRNVMTNEEIARARYVNPPADNRMMRIFGFAYHVNSKGQPATELDRIKQSQNRRFIDDYLSGDQKRRKLHLERITEDMLSMKFTEDMLSDENLRKNAVALKTMGDKAAYMENLMKENPQFFHDLPEEKQERLQAFDTVWKTFPYAVTHKLALLHISIHNNYTLEETITPPNFENEEALTEVAVGCETLFQEACRTMEKTVPGAAKAAPDAGGAAK